MITVPESSDFFHTFNIIQGIYDRFDEWERNLNSDALMGDIQSMLEHSLGVLDNPIYCIDSDFTVLAAAFPERQDVPRPDDLPVNGTALDLSSMDQYLGNYELSMAAKEPLLINLLDQTTLNFNLLDDEKYKGCVTIHYTDAPYKPSDKQIIEFLGAKVMQAMRHVSLASSDARSTIGKVMRDLVEDRPLDSIGRAALLETDKREPLMCARLKPIDKSKRLPLGYIRSIVEKTFPRCMTFEYNQNSVVAFIYIEEESDVANVRHSMETIAPTLGTKVGLSDSFENLIECRLRFLQANRALDIGMTRQPEEGVFLFCDFALFEMIEGATSEMSIELLSPPGLTRLAKHDKESSASYIETLRCFLANNMNTTQTAKDLYIHRSTLMERLARIKRELGLDLGDPDIQLQLRILLKAMEIRDEKQ